LVLPTEFAESGRPRQINVRWPLAGSKPNIRGRLARAWR